MTAYIAYIAYYRVSTASQGRSGLGLEAQRSAVHTFIGTEPRHEFTEVESGKLSDRPELLRALNLAELTGATLIVAKLDRLSRDVEFLSRLQKAPVRIIFADMPFADAFMIGIMAQVAQWEREQISKRTKAALAVASSRGRKLGWCRGNLPAVSREGAAASASARGRQSDARAEKVRLYIREARAQAAAYRSESDVVPRASGFLANQRCSLRALEHHSQVLAR
jgi:DNA invertase Pin-like site-specific DNA recombinase